MPTPSQTVTSEIKNSHQESPSPNCLAISERGIQTAQDFARFMSAMMGDVIAGRISTSKAATAARTGGSLLKVIEMQYKYGQENEQPGKRTLRLID